MDNQLSLKERIEGALWKDLEGKISCSKWANIRASGIEDICDRRLFLYLTVGELAAPFTPEVQAIMEEGKEQEKITRRILSEIGYEITKPTSTERWEGISCNPDGVLDDSGRKYLIEIKSVNDYSWDELQTIEDFKEGKYARKWFGQLQMGMLLFGYEYGAFVLKKKTARLIHIVETKLDWDYADRLVKKAKVVNDAVMANKVPEYLHGNPVECRRCGFFGTSCNPPLDFKETSIIEDSEIEKKLSRREELETARKEYEKIDKDLRDRFRGIPAAICGNYAINGKETTIKYKTQEAREIKGWKTDIKKIQDVTEEIISSSRRG